MSEYLRQYLSKSKDPTWREIRFKTTFHNTVHDVLKSRGYKETEDECWDIYWCDREWIHEHLDNVHLAPRQRVNHFRNHYELTRKDLLIKHIKRAKRACEKNGNIEDAEAYSNITPTTFVLPQEYSMFVEEFKRSAKQSKHWICKPVGRAQGKGIFLLDSLKGVAEWKTLGKDVNNKDVNQPNHQQNQQVNQHKQVKVNQNQLVKNQQVNHQQVNHQPEPYVVQRYLVNPLLIGGRKFDLRLYVLVPSFSPLTVYLYRSGFARFSGSRFSMRSSDLENIAIHLTNVSVQKYQENYDERRGGKWQLQHLKSYLYTCFTREEVNGLFYQIQDVILRSLFAVQSAIIHDKHCFELYGFDILISSDLKPWLLEVNSSPSLTATTQEDYCLKFGLLDDCLSVLDPENFFGGQTEPRVGGFDLIYKGGQRVEPPPQAIYRSYLGCHNDRREQLKKLARAVAARGTGADGGIGGGHGSAIGGVDAGPGGHHGGGLGGLDEDENDNKRRRSSVKGR